jgi:hypothetical protein
MKVIYTGIESSGKSLLLSKQAEKVRQRNIKWYKITGLKRTMAFNSPMAPEFIQLIKNSNINFLQFKNLDEILYLEEADIFIDEVIKYFPASGSNSLSNEQLHFVTQGAKSGIHLWGASQDFSQVHKQFRLLVNEVYVITKLIGSARPMKTAPPVKRIWGICTKRKVNPLSFKGDSATMDQIEGGLSIFFITKKDVQRFDTSYKIPITKLPIKKIRRQEEYCDEDGFRRIRYI